MCQSSQQVFSMSLSRGACLAWAQVAAGLGVLHQVLCCLIYSPFRTLECWEFSNRYMKFHPDVTPVWLNISAHTCKYYCVYCVCLAIYSMCTVLSKHSFLGPSWFLKGIARLNEISVIICSTLGCSIWMTFFLYFLLLNTRYYIPVCLSIKWMSMTCIRDEKSKKYVNCSGSMHILKLEFDFMYVCMNESSALKFGLRIYNKNLPWTLYIDTF